MKNKKAFLSIFYKSFKTDIIFSLATILLINLTPFTPQFASLFFDLVDRLPTISVLLLICGVCVFAYNFSFLYSKKRIDGFFALPLSRTSLFLSQFLAGIIPVILPIAYYYGCYLHGETPLELLTGFIYMTAIVLQLCSLFLVFLTLAGNPFGAAAALTGCGLAGVYIERFIATMSFELTSSFETAASVNASENILTLIGGYINPFLPLWSLFDKIEDYMSGVPRSLYGVEFLNNSLFIFMGFLMWSAISFILFKKRRVELHTSAFTVKGAAVVFATITGLAAFSAAGEATFGFSQSFLGTMISAVLAALSFALLFGIISEKGLQNLKKWALSGLASVLIFSVIIGSLAVGGHIRRTDIPDKGEIEQVTVLVNENVFFSFNDAETVEKFENKVFKKLPLTVSGLEYAKEYGQTDKYIKLRFKYRLKDSTVKEVMLPCKLSEVGEELFECITSKTYMTDLKETVDTSSYVETIHFRRNTIERTWLRDIHIVGLYDAFKADMEQYDADILSSDSWFWAEIKCQNGETVNICMFIGENMKTTLKNLGYKSGDFL